MKSARACSARFSAVRSCSNIAVSCGALLRARDLAPIVPLDRHTFDELRGRGLTGLLRAFDRLQQRRRAATPTRSCLRSASVPTTAASRALANITRPTHDQQQGIGHALEDSRARASGNAHALDRQQGCLRSPGELRPAAKPPNSERNQCRPLRAITEPPTQAPASGRSKRRQRGPPAAYRATRAQICRDQNPVRHQPCDRLGFARYPARVLPATA